MNTVPARASKHTLTNTVRYSCLSPIHASWQFAALGHTVRPVPALNLCIYCAIHLNSSLAGRTKTGVASLRESESKGTPSGEEKPPERSKNDAITDSGLSERSCTHCTGGCINKCQNECSACGVEGEGVCAWVKYGEWCR